MTKTIDITKPLEAVHTATGKVVPMTYAGPDGLRLGGGFTTVECPCGETTNEYWNLDGTDRCINKEWTIRNVAPAFDPTKPVQTREGRPVRIICTDAPGDKPIIGLIAGCGSPKCRAADGRMLASGSYESRRDFVNAPETTELFVNVGTRKDTLPSRPGYPTSAYTRGKDSAASHAGYSTVKLTLTDGIPTAVELVRPHA